MRQRERKRHTNEDYVDDEERRKMCLYVRARGCFDFASSTFGAHSVYEEIIELPSRTE